MTRVLLIQLPAPQMNFGMRSGNVPLAPAILKQSVSGLAHIQVDIVPEQAATGLGDQALLNHILEIRPDIIGFSIFNWNIVRSLWMTEAIKGIYCPKIVFGGPEVTQDNPLLDGGAFDFLVFGEGEALFIRLLEDMALWEERSGSASAEAIFRKAGSPYPRGLIDPSIDGLAYVESQRGCPHRCGFCYYHKGGKKITRVPVESVVETLQWAKRASVDELCFIDPSLNSRPDLETLLREAEKVNKDRSLSLTGEIRIDGLDRKTADLYQMAGFTGFEIGLQSVTPEALALMNRKTDLKKFLKGAHLLKEREIVPRIDLIAGLPGDTLEGFRRSVDLLHGEGLDMDVQVFPLAVLPGTDFRLNHKRLGIAFDPSPPYTVRHTTSFSEEEIMQAFDYAESVFDLSLFPAPDIQIPLYDSGWSGNGRGREIEAAIDGKTYVKSLLLFPGRAMEEIETIAERMTHPYQIMVSGECADESFIRKALCLLSSKNPFTPFEVIFIEPRFKPNTERLLEAVQLRRPHYLDTDLRFVYGKKGNRAVIFTVLTGDEEVWFTGEMKRQVFWWRKKRLPSRHTLEAFFDWDGVFIDVKKERAALETWQNQILPHAPELVELCFALPELQKRWIDLTCPETYI